MDVWPTGVEIDVLPRAHQRANRGLKVEFSILWSHVLLLFSFLVVRQVIFDTKILHLCVKRKCVVKKINF